ncbi:MAG: MFS transporter [Eggerthellaceae bacterium]|nr:MFS transporter [Eggerthellaceae bacterium]
MDVSSIKRKRYVYLFASAASFLVLGLVYAWSLFATPLATIYGWEMAAVKVTFTICMMSFCVGGLIGVRVLKKLGVRGAILLAATLLVCGFAGTALLAPRGIWALYLCYGVLIGCGTGLGYNVTIATVTLWFPDRTGFASGVMFMGFGLGSLTLGTLANTIIETAGIPTALAVVAATACVVFVLLSLFLKRAPDNIGELLGVEGKAAAKAGAKDAAAADGETGAEAGAQAKDAAATDGDTEAETRARATTDAEADQRRIFRDPAFYGYYLWAIIILGAGLAMIGTSKQGALELGIFDAFATTLVGIIPIVNGLSGLSMGVIYDKKGLRFSMILVASVAFVSCTILACAFRFGQAPLYVVGCLVLVTAYGSVAPLATGFARERYGQKRFPHHLAIVNTDIAGGSAFQQAVTSACAGASPAIYAAMAVFGGVALLTSIVFARFTKSKRE